MVNLGNIMGRLGKQREGFPKRLTEADMMETTTTTAAGVWITVGNFIVPPQQAYRYGFGNAAQPANQGYMYIALKNATGVIQEGSIRLVVNDANNLNPVTVFQERTEVLRGSTFDRSLMIPLPLKTLGRGARAGLDPAIEDMRLEIQFEADVTGAVTKAQSKILMPTTLYQ